MACQKLEFILEEDRGYRVKPIAAIEAADHA
jgi:hypothetical protein